jgi:hypothetical protein
MPSLNDGKAGSDLKWSRFLLTLQGHLRHPPHMANVLPLEKQAVAIGALCEGNSIRSVERMTGIHRDTVMRLGARVGMACRDLMDETMRELPCAQIEVDEIWGFVGKKQRNVEETDSAELGDVWTWVAIDPETKAVPVFHVGKRTATDANAFMSQVSARMAQRIQLSSDGLNLYTGGG